MAEPHVCPWWVGYFLVSPFRQLLQKPEQIVGPYVREGMTVLEVGPGMGFFTLPMARMVGERGRIVAVDVQERMLKGLTRRARRAGLADRITPVRAMSDSLNVHQFTGRVDFALAFAVVHEVPDQEKLLREIHATLKDSAFVLLSEPTGHVSETDFSKTLSVVVRLGFAIAEQPTIRKSNSVLLKRLS